MSWPTQISNNAEKFYFNVFIQVKERYARYTLVTLKSLTDLSGGGYHRFQDITRVKF